MRLLRIEGEGFGGRAIDLHPAVSVLGDADDDLRARLVAVCEALPGGTTAGCGGLIEAHDVLFDFHEDSLGLLALDTPLPVVIGRSADPSTEEEDDPRSAPEILREPLVETRRVRDRLAEAELIAVNDLEEARKDLDPYASVAYEQALEAVEAAEGDGLPDEVSVQALREQRDDLVGRLDEHEATRPDAVRSALEEADSWSGSDPVAEEARALAAELAQLDRELVDLDAALDEQERNPLDLARSRDALSVEVARLESQALPPEVHPDDRDALEQAHDEVVETQARVAGSLLGGRSAHRRLEDAVAAEIEVLDRIGLPTYSAYVMSLTVGATDPKVEADLYEARQALGRAQEELENATVALEEDPVRRTIALRLDEIVARAGELIGRDPGPDVARALDEFREARLGTTPVDQLRHELERQGVLAGGMDLEDADVLDLARAWLQEHDTFASGLAERRTELAAFEDEVAEAEVAIAEAGEQPPTPEESALADVTGRHEAHVVAASRVAGLIEALADVEEKRNELDLRIQTQESVLEAAEDAAAGEGPDEESTALSEARAALRSAVADVTDRSFAGSVPLVVDGLFGDLDRAETDVLLDEMEEVAERVQIIVLDDVLELASWATAVGLDRAAVIAPE